MSAVVVVVFFAVGLAAWTALSFLFGEDRVVSRRLKGMTQYESLEAREARPILKPFSERVFSPVATRFSRSLAVIGPRDYRKRLRAKLAVAGVLVKRVYTEGTDVKEGDLLFQIDPAPLQAALNAQLANLAAAQATAQNNHVAAERARSIAGKGLMSKTDMDNAEAAERTMRGLEADTNEYQHAEELGEK